MKLAELINVCSPTKIVGETEIEVSGIEIDSRLIKSGNMFVAMRGTQVDGHTYIAKAIELGAKTIVCEELPAAIQNGVTYIQYNKTDDVVGPLATTLAILQAR